MKKIKLTQNKYALVDDFDYEWLNQWKWQSHLEGYVTRTQYFKGDTKEKRNRSHIKMHRLIMNTPKDMQTDHINGNGLDNRRSNLRICTSVENNRNSRIYNRKDKTSIYKGVSQRDKDSSWVARIRYNGKLIHLGSFKTGSMAASVYNLTAKKLFGEFAKLNKIKHK